MNNASNKAIQLFNEIKTKSEQELIGICHDLREDLLKIENKFHDSNIDPCENLESIKELQIELEKIKLNQ